MYGIQNMVNPRFINVTPLTSTENSSTIPPTSWVQSYFGSLSVANTWALAQSFSTSVKSQIIDCITAATTASLFDSSTGTTNICNNSNDVNIGTSQPATSNITIGTATNSTVSINGTLRTQSIFAPLASLGTTSGVYSTNTGVINIGSSTATPTIRGTLQLNQPMRCSYTPTASAPYGYASNEIGYTLTTSTVSSLLASRTGLSPQFVIFTDLSITAGTWLLTYTIRVKTNNATNSTMSQYSSWFYLNGSNGNFPGQYGDSFTSAIKSMNNGVNSIFGTASTVYTTSATVNINVAFFGTGTLVGAMSISSDSILSATRIA